jgi:hypothetical protein
VNTKQIIILVGNLVIGAAVVVAFALGKLDGTQLVVVLAALGFPSIASAFAPPKPATTTDASLNAARKRTPPPLPLILVLVGASLVAGAAIPAATIGCEHPPTPAQIKDVTETAQGGCRLLQAVTTDGTVRQICATVDEVSLLEQVVLGAREGGAPRAAASCTVVSERLCATDDELAEGIDAVIAARRARLRRQSAGAAAPPASSAR